jgi:hypothetical protein
MTIHSYAAPEEESCGGTRNPRVVRSVVLVIVFVVLTIHTPAHATAGCSPAGSLGLARARHTATALGDRRVLVAGGRIIPATTPESTPTAELYDGETWTAVASMHDERVAHTATLLADGRVLVVGGFRSHPPQLSFVPTAEIFDPASGQWALAANPATARANHAAALLDDGRVLVAGGQIDPFPTYAQDAGDVLGPMPGYPSAAAEIYNPAGDRWLPVAPMLVPRDFFTLTTLHDGSVLATAGDTMAGHTNTAELFDPALNVWIPTAPAEVARAFHDAVLLADGRVAAVGGALSVEPPPYLQEVASVEIYDPITRAWSPTGALPSARWWPGAVGLPDGSILAAGGIAADFANQSTTHLDAVDRWDPSTASWTTVAQLATPRGSQTVAYGTGVLVTGGGKAPFVAQTEFCSPY